MSFRAPTPATGPRDLIEMVRGLFDGKSNNTGTVTLRASQTTTTLTDPRIGAGSVVLLAPQTAAAKTAYVAGIYQACTTGSATLTHASNAAVDQTFGYVVVG